jgi:uncharacterized DUF497 family protein
MILYHDIETRSKFDWDDNNIGHLSRHKIAPAEFEEAISNDPSFIDVRDEVGEDRGYALGATNKLRVLFLVYTDRGNRVRPVTAWDAGKKTPGALLPADENIGKRIWRRNSLYRLSHPKLRMLPGMRATSGNWKRKWGAEFVVARL